MAAILSMGDELISLVKGSCEGLYNIALYGWLIKRELDG